MRLKGILIGLLIIASASIRVEASGNLSNYQAMFMYNFLRHVNWPAEGSGGNFTIGVYNDEAVYAKLATLTAGRKVGTKTIVIRRISSATDAKSCQLVFIPSDLSSKMADFRAQLGNNSCLLIGGKEGSIANGSTIEFLIKDDKLKFRINEDRAKQQNLVFSKALLDMAV